MADSKWSGQKASASTRIKQLLADGQERSVQVVVDDLKATGLTGKNALKAIYTEVAAGTAVLSGNWSDGTVRRGGA